MSSLLNPSATADTQSPAPEPPVADVVVRSDGPIALPRSRRRRRVAVGLLVAVVLAATAAGAYVRNVNKSAVASQPITVPLARGDVASTIIASGNVRPVSIVKVSTLQGGTLTQIPVDFNSDVRRGQLLARIDDVAQRNELRRATAEVAAATSQDRMETTVIAQREAEVAAAEAQHESSIAGVAAVRIDVSLADAALARANALLQKGAVTAVAVLNAQSASDTAVAKLRQAQSEANRTEALLKAASAGLGSARTQKESSSANLEQALAHEQKARIDLERTNIRSPVNGTIVWKSVDVGQTVSTNVEPPVLFFIAQDLTKVQIETTVDEADVGRLRVGQEVSFTVAAYPGEQFKGTVRQIRTGSEALFGSRAGAASAVTYIVEITTENKDRRLLPGMTASVRIITAAAKDALTVPSAALRYGETFVASNNIAMPNVSGTRPVVVMSETGRLFVLVVRPLASDGITTAVAATASLSGREQVIVAERPLRRE
jgi:HlyD family secretion protein